jgi:membrane dipeptidase
MSEKIDLQPPLAVFDGHNDMLTREDHLGFVSGRPGGHVDLGKMRSGGMRGGMFAVWVPSSDLDPEPVQRTDGVREFAMPPEVPHAIAKPFVEQAAGGLLELERMGHLRVARTIYDIDEARTANRPPVAVLHFEGAEAIDDDLTELDLWSERGLRSLGPVWSRPNRFAHGVPFMYPASPDTGPGLTDLGRALVRRCAELGILVDLAHMNERGFWDVAAEVLGPLVVSHTGAHAISPASRNLTDHQLDAVADTDGLVGVVFASQFLRPDFANTADTDLSHLIRHIEYIADRIGIDKVALGSDFDGAVIPNAIGDASGLPRVLDALAAGGAFSDADLRLFAWDNWRRVLAAWWGELPRAH